jgi:dephospho-CoA kinase
MATRPLRIALTGGISSGKSVCLATFKQLGAAVIDADQLAREAVAPGSSGLAAVVARFGASVQHADGSLNREALAALIFTSGRSMDARQELEEIIHPRVYAGIARWFAALRAPIGIADIPLLYETGRSGDFDAVVVASCRADQQLARLMARDGLSEADARARLATQWPLADKAAHADYVIDTSGTLEQTKTRTEDVWGKLQSGIGNR